MPIKLLETERLDQSEPVLFVHMDYFYIHLHIYFIMWHIGHFNIKIQHLTENKENHNRAG